MNRKLFVVMQVVVLALVGSAVGTAAGRFSSPPGAVGHSLGMASNASPLTPVGSGFTYQGRLLDGGNPANGSYDFQIILYDALVGGNQVGPIITATNQLVSDGLITLTLDFGAGAFDGSGRWLEVQVRPAGGGGYTVLTPRQAVTAAPYAMRAASVADGSITDASISPNSSIEFGNDLARQAIINGNFNIWQRNTSVTNPTHLSFVSDRWLVSYQNSGTGPTNIIHSRQSLTAGDIFGAFYFYRINPDGAGSGFAATDSYGLSQKIEHGTRFLCGASKKVTVSFWARSSITNKKLGLYLLQRYGSGGSSSSAENIVGTNWTLTPSWTKYTFTFTTNTLAGKTFGSNNDDSLELAFQLMWGSSSASFVGAQGVETFGGSGNIDIAQVQVSAGAVALPFQPKSFEQELTASQRYYEKSYAYDLAPGSVANDVTVFVAYNAEEAFGSSPYKVRKRVSPTVTIYAAGGASGAADRLGIAPILGVTAYTPIYGSEYGFSQVNRTGGWAANDKIGFLWTADAELP